MDIASVPSVTPTSLPDGEENVPYSEELISTAGTGPYLWSVSSGSLPPGLFLDPSTGQVTGTPTTPGTYSFTASVIDSVGARASQAYTVTVEGPPSITTPSLGSGEVGAGYSQTLTATAGTGQYTWSIGTGALPPGLSLDPTTGAISGTPTTAGDFGVTAVVTDSLGQIGSHAYTVDVVPGPAIAPVTLAGGELGVAYNAALDGSAGTGPYTWSIGTGALPPGLSLDPTTGAIDGTPTGTAAGSDSFTVDLTDANGVQVQRSYEVTIAAGPAITTGVTLPDGNAGEAYDETLSVSGGTSPYSWSLGPDSQLPPGLSFDAANATLAGTPSTTGTFSFVATVTDALGQSSTKTFTLTITSVSTTVPPLSSAPASSGLTITTPTGSGSGSSAGGNTSGALGGLVGTGYSATLSVAGGAGPYAWSLRSGSLPPGLSLDPSTGTIDGMPTVRGTYTFTVTVTDAQGRSFSEAVTIVIGGDNESVSGPTVTEAATTGAFHASTLPKPSGGKAPYVWTIASGSLPAGLSLDPKTGEVTGTATTPGSYTVTLKLTDAAAHVYFEAVTMTVVAPSPGYRLVGSDGGVFDFRTSFQGSCELSGSRCQKLDRNVDAIASTPDGRGYWLAAKDGGVFAFGDARFYGSCRTSEHPCGPSTSPVVAIASTPDGNGYWLATADGAVYHFGDAASYGSCTSDKQHCGDLPAHVVGIAASRSGGYWLATARGDVFCFGKGAPDLGSCVTKGSRCTALDAHVVGIASAPAGSGYWLAAADGGVFAFGEARFYGNTRTAQVERTLVGRVMGIAYSS